MSINDEIDCHPYIMEECHVWASWGARWLQKDTIRLAQLSADGSVSVHAYQSILDGKKNEIAFVGSVTFIYLSVLRLTGAVWRLWKARRPLARVSPGNTSFLMPQALFCHVSENVLTPYPSVERASRLAETSFRQFSKTSVRTVDSRETQPLEIYCSIAVLKISKHFICLI